MTRETDPESPSATRIGPRRMTLAIAAAVILNLAVYGLGSAAGATWLANGQTIPWILVVIATVLAMTAGTLLTWLLAKLWAKAQTAMAWIGLAFGVVTAPAPLLSSDSRSTGLALATMHAVTGVIWFVAVRPRRASSSL